MEDNLLVLNAAIPAVGGVLWNPTVMSLQRVALYADIYTQRRDVYLGDHSVYSQCCNRQVRLQMDGAVGIGDRHCAKVPLPRTDRGIVIVHCLAVPGPGPQLRQLQTHLLSVETAPLLVNSVDTGGTDDKCQPVVCGVFIRQLMHFPSEAWNPAGKCNLKTGLCAEAIPVRI